MRLADVFGFSIGAGRAVIAKSVAATVEKGDLQVEISVSGSAASVYSQDISASSSGEVDEVLADVVPFL